MNLQEKTEAVEGLKERFSRASVALLAEPQPDLADMLGYPEGMENYVDNVQGSFANVGNTCYLNALLHALASFLRRLGLYVLQRSLRSACSARRPRTRTPRPARPRGVRAHGPATLQT